MAYSDEHYVKAIISYLVTRGLPDTYKDNYLQRRLNVRIRKTKNSDLGSYYHYLKNTPQEFEELKKDLSINVTKFFRDLESFKYFENVLVDRLIEHNKLRKGPFRIWSAGCAIGAEPYSVAIIVDRAIRKHNLRSIDVKIHATDFNEELLSIARIGVYDEAIIEDISDEILEKYFDQTINKEQYRIKYGIKKYIDFSHLDLTGKFPFRNLDAIICRNVLIYFSSEAQHIVFKKYYDCLKSNGLLFIGKTETMHISYRGNFNNISPKHRVYLKIDPNEIMDQEKRSILICSECGMSFSRDLDLRLHLKKHEKDKEKANQEKFAQAKKNKDILICQICAKQFITEVRYNAHLKFFHQIVGEKKNRETY